MACRLALLLQVKLPAQRASVKPVKVTATCLGQVAEILDVVFGDVWMGAGTALDTTNLQRLNLSSADTEVRFLTAPVTGDWQEWSLSPLRPHGKAKQWSLSPLRPHGKAKRVVGIIFAGVERGKLKSWSTPTGKWVKRILLPMSPFPLKGILWYHGTPRPTPEEMQQTRSFLLQTLGAPDAEFRE